MGLLSLPLLPEGTALPSLSLGGVLGGATFPFSSVGWCCLASFVGWCCVIPSLLFAWCCLPSPPFGGAAFSPSSVKEPLGLLRWLVMRCSLSFFVVLPSFPFFFGWGCFLTPLLLEGAALPCLSLGGVASGPLSFCVVLPSFSPFWWCCFLSPLLLGGVAWPLSLNGVALFPLLLRGAAFLFLLPWVGLFLSPLLLGWCCPPSPPLGGDGFPPSSVGRCCLPSPPPSGGAPFVTLFCWVVLLCLLHLWGYFFLLFCWVVPLGLPLWVVLRLVLSSFAWCCLPSPLGGAAFPLLFSWVVLLGLLRWVVLRYSLSFCVVLPTFPTFFGRVSFKKKNQKNRTKRS